MTLADRLALQDDMHAIAATLRGVDERYLHFTPKRV
jgi:hypothetical protein